MRIPALCFLGISISAIVAGCGGSAEPGSSTITGTIDQASFPLVVESIDVISDQSAPTTAAVAADGSFTLSLTEGASYRFTIGKDSIPLILRTDGGRLQTQITITGGDAKADIGSVRFFDASTLADGFDTSSTETCVDGLIVRTGQPCTLGEAPVTCEERGDHRGPGGKGHHRPPPPPDGAGFGDGDGDHAEVAIADDPATDASPRQAIAVPERTIATGIGCGGDCPGM